MKMNKKNYPQVYLEEYKYKIKKIHAPRFINIELETDSESIVIEVIGTVFLFFL